jgi:transposase-like protein
MSFDRAVTVRKIDDLLDGHCKTCTIRTDYNREYGGNTPFITQHCSKVCPVGLQLAGLGRELIGKVRPRKQITLEVEDIMAKPKFTMTAEEHFAERQSGKSIAQIAKEQGVSEQTIYSRMNKWAEEGKTAESPKETQLLREKETLPPQPAVNLPGMYKKALQEIEELKAALSVTQPVSHDMLKEYKVTGERLAVENTELKAELDQTTTARDEYKRLYEEQFAFAQAYFKQAEDLKAENGQLQEELNRLITERDEMQAHNDRLNDMLDEAARESMALRPTEPASEVQLLDRSIAELTRAKWILGRLSASGE